MARPRIQIDWKKVEHMCAIQCTLAEIASKLEISEDTIERACKREQKVTFDEYFQKHRLKGFVSLRHKQFEMAMSGNHRMVELLGKNWLGQTDKQQIDHTSGGQPLYKVIKGVSLEDL